MVSPTTVENVAEGVVAILPPEIASQLVLLVKAIGGLFVLYLIFLAIRFYFIRKQTRMIREMNEGIEKIKKKLKIK